MDKQREKEILAALPKRKKRREKGSGTKKYGRNRVKCERYRREGRRERNKRRRIAKDAKRGTLPLVPGVSA